MFTLKYVAANYKTHKIGALKKLDASILEVKRYTHTAPYAKPWYNTSCSNTIASVQILWLLEA